MPTDAQYVLVIGGAGYIGSHMTLLLRQNGFIPVVLDNLSKGNAHAVYDAELIVGNVGNQKLLTSLFCAYPFVAVMHFASYIDVHASIYSPHIYYRNNVMETLNLLDVMVQHQLPHLIFSSSASVYGEPQYTPIDETHVLNPLSPYGRSKRMIEEIILDYEQQFGFTSAILRYFNASGADPDNKIGERHVPETHLIPLILQVAAGEKQDLPIYGNDYQTPDGTCVRDYIHVNDICAAHLLCLSALLNGQQSMIYNLGFGRGYSVSEVIHTAQEVTQLKIKTSMKPKRAGDPAVLVANADKIKGELGWTPQYPLHTIVRHAWNYMQSIIE